MGLKNTFRSKIFLSLAIASFAASKTAGAQSSSFNFIPEAKTDTVYSSIGGLDRLSLGVYTSTLIPFASSHTSTSNTTEAKAVNPNQELRYQVPVGFGLDLSYGVLKNLEIGIAAGFEFFETQQVISESANGETKQIDSMKLRMFPVQAILRYRIVQKKWAPEFELGLGGAFASFTAKSSTTTVAAIKKDDFILRGHIAAGAGFSWAESSSVHFQIGYGLNMLGEQEYKNSSGNLSITQESTSQGIFAKGSLRFYL